MSLLLPIIYSLVPAIVLHVVITLDLRTPWSVAPCAGVLFVCWICTQHAKTNIMFFDYCFGIYIAMTAMDAIHMTLLVRPLHVFRHQKQTESAHKLPWFERFIWTAKLCGSPRGIGWNHQVKNLPEIPTESKKDFAFSRLMTAAKHYLCFDLAQFYIRHDPGFKSPAAFLSQTFVRRLLDFVVILLCHYCLAIVLHSLIVVLVVSCTSAEPSSWPNLFGKWKETYTIRRFWGRTWHQLFRRFMIPFGKKLTSFLGFRPGTNGSSYTQLYTAFFVTAIAHAVGDTMINPSRFGISFPLFIYQALAITFEDVVIAAVRRAGVKETKWTHVMGNVWVFSWCMVIGVPWFSEVVTASGDNGVQLVSFKYFPPSLCDILIGNF